jgi:hypothetical protein
MSLVDRQKLLYVDRCDIYSLGDFELDERGLVSGRSVATGLSFSSVACRFVGRLTDEFVSDVGRSSEGLARFYFAADQVVDEGWVIKLVSAGHPLFGRCWRVVSVPRVMVGGSRRVVNQKVVDARLV